MAFLEERFPLGVAFGSSGGPERKTEVVSLGSGYEERNAVWAGSRRSYNVGTGIKTYEDLDQVIALFEVVNGRLDGFRFRDPSDYKSTRLSATTPLDQLIGTGAGAQTEFQLVKNYTRAARTYTREIKKPVEGTVRVAVAGVEQLAGWAVDTTTGLVSFDVAPTGAVTAGYEFDVPVRFDTDKIEVNWELLCAGEAPTIPIIEIRIAPEDLESGASSS